MKKMKPLLFLFFAIIGLIGCATDVQKKEETPKDGVEVIYFHGKQRCATCNAIEKETTALIDSQFAEEVKNGKVRFRVVDITKAENEALADKYEITWSSLIVVKYNNGNENAENLTKFAFANARNNPTKFKNELAAKINQMLK